MTAVRHNVKPETLIVNCDQVAEDDERFASDRKKEALKQAILGCPELMSLEMFENEHIKQHKRSVDYKECQSMVTNMCGSLDAAREASRSGHSKWLSQAHESNTSEYAANIHEADETQEDEDGLCVTRTRFSQQVWLEFEISEC